MRMIRAVAVVSMLVPSAAWAMGAKAKGPVVHAHVASEDAFLVSSYAIQSGREILLVDAQMVKPEVDKFIEKVKALEGKVTTIYVTHAHPDHYLGLAWLKAAFPEAKVVADADTVDRIAAEGAGTLGWFQKDFMGGKLSSILPTSVVTPEKLTGKTLKVGDVELEVLSYADAEAKGAHALWHKDTGTLVTGDLAFNNVHLWLKETKPETWIPALDALIALPVQRVYPGHGEPGGKEILTKDKAYLQAFDGAVKASKDGESLAKTVKESQTGWRVSGIVDMAVPTYFSAPAPAAAVTDAKPEEKKAEDKKAEEKKPAAKTAPAKKSGS